MRTKLWVAYQRVFVLTYLINMNLSVQKSWSIKKEIYMKLAASEANEKSVDDWLDMIQDYAQLEELDRATLVRLIQKN